jgi:hypothetical protein
VERAAVQPWRTQARRETNADTTAPSGTLDARTGKYTLQWTSQIAGGPFNGFTGIWHREGTFKQKS